MPTINLDVLAIEFEFVDPPGIHVEVDLQVPHHIPEVGGKKIHLGGITLSLANPTVSLPVDVEVFKGNIDFSLVTSNCTFTVEGEIEVDVKVYKHKWKFGPESYQYMNPLTSLFTFNNDPVFNSVQSAQDKINNAPASNQGQLPSRNTDESDPAVQALKDVMAFAGIADLETTAGKFLNDFMSKQTFLNPSEPSNKLAALSGGATDAVVLLAFGFSAGGGAMAGVAGGDGFYITTKNKGKDLTIGVYGGAAFSAGLLAGIAAGFTYTIYWPDAGNSPIDNFKGFNDYVSADTGIGIAVGATLFWPADSNFSAQSGAPCGITLFGGVGLGLPFDVFGGGSYTAVSPPATIVK